MKVALTGATGFIGRYIAREFMTSEDSLRTMVRPTSDTAFLESGGAELLVGDFGDDASMQRLVADVDVVIHNGYWHDRNELEAPVKWFEMNVLGSLKMLEYARLAGVKRFVFISSGAVYGTVPNPDAPRDENTPATPRGGYAAYNRAVETYVSAYHHEWQMTGSTSIRLCGVNVGIHPRNPNWGYADIVRRAIADEDIHVGGRSQFDCCVDIGRNLRLVATLPLDAVDEVYCFGDDVVTMREIAETIVRALGSASRVIEDAEPAACVPCSNARIRSAGGTFSGLAGISAWARELCEHLKA